jgi:hypothetical protein
LNRLQALSPENLNDVEKHLTTEAAEMLRKVETILNKVSASPEHTRSAKGVSPSVTSRSAIGVRSEGRSVQRQDEEENRSLKEVLKDLHVCPIQVVENVEVSQLMGALSLSAHEHGGDESVVFPLVVVRVLQVSYCLFKSMCFICP